MNTMTIAQAAKALGIQVDFTGEYNSVCTDTRDFTPGCLFVALKGENFDGHSFAAQAMELGAAAVLCERDCGCEKQLLVRDTREGLLALAAYYRSRFPLQLVALTGSVGKTTTKEMCACVLEAKYKTLKTEGNFNNEIGMPMTVFRLDESYDVAVLEMGMSDFGEISRLSRAAKPTLAILTNIGISHIEKLGSKEGILRAKLEILEGLAPDAPVVLNADDPLLAGAAIMGHPVYTYGIDNPHCRFKAYGLQAAGEGVRFVLDYGVGEQPVTLPTAGRHNVYNALAAFAAGFLLGVDPEQAAKALLQYRPAGRRQLVRDVKGITFIEDCYNASPDSQRAALSVLRESKATRRIAVLGDMLELGAFTRQAHEEVGREAARQSVDILLTVGEHSSLTAECAKKDGLAKVEHFTDKEALAARLTELLTPGDAVLFKASNGMKLDDVIVYAYQALGYRAPEEEETQG